MTASYNSEAFSNGDEALAFTICMWCAEPSTLTKIENKFVWREPTDTERKDVPDSIWEFQRVFRRSIKKRAAMN